MATLECPSCGRQSPGSAERCSECGLIFTPGIRRQALTGSEVGRRRRVLDLVLLTAVVIVAVVLYQGRNRAGVVATPASLGGAGLEPAPSTAINDSARDVTSTAESPRPAPGSEPSTRPPPPPPPPARRVDTPTAVSSRPVSRAADTAQRVIAPARADAAPSVARQPSPSPAAGDSARPAASPPAAGLVERFARTWVNVRAGRSGATALVRTLRPGEPVLVDSLVEGWYRIVVDGRTDGYVDQAYLDEAPPRTEE